MLQSDLVNAVQLQSDHISIGGKTLAFEQIFNEAFFTPGKIKELRETFSHNTPFPHLVLEGLFSPLLLELMYSEFDTLKWNDWKRYDTENEVKFGSRPYCRLGLAAQVYFNTIHSGMFVDLLQQITGIEGLLPDPALDNGGLHESPTGGKFALHVDFNQHFVTKLDSRLVFITYLNKNWLPSYGGALELWNMDEGKCTVEIEPVFGRSILFLHTSKSLHGFPNPVNAPGGRPRRSAAAYFYSNGHPEGKSTTFLSTAFPMPVSTSRRGKTIAAIKFVAPPFIISLMRSLRYKLRK
jgi:hypothetical protein